MYLSIYLPIYISDNLCIYPSYLSLPGIYSVVFVKVWVPVAGVEQGQTHPGGNLAVLDRQIDKYTYRKTNKKMDICIGR